MSKKRHTKEARIRAIREQEAGRSQAEICRQLNIIAPNFYRFEKDNKELKQMVADQIGRSHF
jgi:transposase-like protein